MITQRLSLLLAIALPFAGLSAVAADQPTAETDRRAHVREHLQQVIDQLDLTEEQRTAITPIIQQEITDLKAVREDASLRRLQKARKVRSINDDASAKIRALLTAEQQEKYDELRAEMKKEMKERAKERKAAPQESSQ